MSETKRSALIALLAASRAPATQKKPSVAWNECLDVDTIDLNHKVHLLWTLVAELDAGRCKTIGAHQLGNLLEKLALLQHRVLLDSIGQHFIQRLASYGTKPCRSTACTSSVTLPCQWLVMTPVRDSVSAHPVHAWVLKFPRRCLSRIER